MMCNVAEGTRGGEVQGEGGVKGGPKKEASARAKTERGCTTRAMGTAGIGKESCPLEWQLSTEQRLHAAISLRLLSAHAGDWRGLSVEADSASPKIV